MAGFKIEGLGELVNVLEKAAAKVPNAKRQFLAKEAGLVRSRAMKHTPVDTGLLRGSWKQTPANDNSVTIYNNVHYGIFVEKGHRVKIHGKFTGKVVQLIEDDDEIQIRLAVNSDYDTILFCGYSPDIVSSRVLEDDIITIYYNNKIFIFV